MFWNHRVTKRKTDFDEGTGSNIEFGIREVFYNDNGEVYAIAEEADSPWGESFEDLKSDMEHYMKALDNPVIDLDTIKYADMDPDDSEDEDSGSEI